MMAGVVAQSGGGIGVSGIGQQLQSRHMFVFQLMCEIRFKDHQQLDLVAAEGLFCFGHIVGHQRQVE